MAVGFGKDQCFGYFKIPCLIESFFEDGWQIFFKCSDNGADLIGVHHILVQLL